ncbi:MAG: metal-dependent transcriptional regulator [Candidatus Micrarchaeota archaeon]
MLTRKTEDYLEMILDLTDEKGYARTKDLAAKMKVKSPSVTEMLGKLSREGLVVYEKYGGTRLTSEGLSMAKKIKKRHEIFERFLKIIFVSDKVAGKDACIMEHHLDPETNRQLSRFVSFVNGFGRRPEFINHFERFCKTGKLPKCIREVKK